MPFQNIVNDVEEHNRPVNNTLDIIAELVDTGSDVLNAAELHQLQSDKNHLKQRYDFVSHNSDKLCRCMQSALEELKKYRTDMSGFKTWIEHAFNAMNDKERQLTSLRHVQETANEFKTFISDVVAHGADLKLVSISCQKFLDLSKVMQQFNGEELF